MLLISRLTNTKKGNILAAWIGSFIAIAAIALLATLTENPLLMAPIGASAVLAFSVPGSPLARPKNIVLGHILTASIGVAVYFLIGNGWMEVALAVATAIALMQTLDIVHPPAGANPIVAFATCAGWHYVLLPVAISAILLATIALVFNRFALGRNYPNPG